MTNKRFELKNNDRIPSWLEGFYNEYLPDSGIFVEVGVGHTIDRSWTEKDTSTAITEGKKTITQRCGSNTLDLLDYNFSGVYIEPVEEFCEELRLITAGKEIEILNFGCSDKEEVLSLYGGETFHANSHVTWPGGVNYIGRQVRCYTLSAMLDQLGVSQPIDLMSIDVEGWEMKVLKGIRDEHWPRLLVIEINKPSSFGIWGTLERNGYVLYCQDGQDAGFIKTQESKK